MQVVRAFMQCTYVLLIILAAQIAIVCMAAAARRCRRAARQGALDENELMMKEVSV